MQNGMESNFRFHRLEVGSIQKNEAGGPETRRRPSLVVRSGDDQRLTRIPGAPSPSAAAVPFGSVRLAAPWEPRQ